MVTERLRKLRKRCLVALATFGLALLGTEAALQLTPLGDRIYYNAPIYVNERLARPSKAFTPDPDVGWRMRPGSRVQFPTEGRQIEYLADAEGFRTARNRKVSDRPHRITLVGDSFAWGFGVHWEETCAAHLETRFPGTSVPVLAMPGFGLDQIMESVRHWALPRNPTLVLVAIFSDDLSRSFTAFRETEGLGKPLYHLEAEKLTLSTEADRPGALQRFLERKSKLYSAFWVARRVIGKRYGLGSWWKLNQALLEGMTAELQAAEVPVLFVHIPKRNGEPLPALTSYLQSHGQNLIDLAELPKSELESFYFETDGHFSPQGHRKLAHLVGNWIEVHLPQLH